MNGFLHTSGTAYISIIWSEVMKDNSFSSCVSNSACEPVSSMVPEVSLSRVRSAFILVLLSLYLRDEDTRGRRTAKRCWTERERKRIMWRDVLALDFLKEKGSCCYWYLHQFQSHILTCMMPDYRKNKLQPRYSRSSSITMGYHNGIW